MKSKNKIILIAGSIFILNIFLGFDFRFTAINIIWLIPIILDMNEKKQ